MHILVVEDERSVQVTLLAELTEAGHTVLARATGEEGLDLARRERFDLIILDIGLPGMSGMEVAAGLRGEGDTTPIIFLTARDTEEDVVAGLDLGADGYVTKPFSVAELRARLRALERRLDIERQPGVTLGDVTLDPVARQVNRAGKAVRLTDVEFRLLREIVSARGRIVGREELLRTVWRLDFDPETGLLDVHLSNLRRKLRRIGPPFLETVRGEGFRAVLPEE